MWRPASRRWSACRARNWPRCSARIGVPAAQRKMRAQQIWHWLYVRGASASTRCPASRRSCAPRSTQHFTLERPEVVTEQVSADGTRKWLLRLPGEHAGERPHEIETVYIPESDRGTLCVSSQVGCTLTCSFCHTGTQRLVRNLTAGEIVGQIMVARDRLGDFLGDTRPGRGLPTEGERCVSNIVMMGMGEPLYNFEAVRDALLLVVGRRGLSPVEAPHHALDLGRRAEHRAHRRRDRLHARDLAACGARRSAQRTGAAQPQISDPGTARRLPQLSRRLERAAHHVRIRDAEGRQRFARRRARRWCGCSRAFRPRSI